MSSLSQIVSVSPDNDQKKSLVLSKYTLLYSDKELNEENLNLILKKKDIYKILLLPLIIVYSVFVFTYLMINIKQIKKGEIALTLLSLLFLLFIIVSIIFLLDKFKNNDFIKSNRKLIEVIFIYLIYLIFSVQNRLLNNLINRKNINKSNYDFIFIDTEIIVKFLWLFSSLNEFILVFVTNIFSVFFITLIYVNNINNQIWSLLTLILFICFHTFLSYIQTRLVKNKYICEFEYNRESKINDMINDVINDVFDSMEEGLITMNMDQSKNEIKINKVLNDIFKNNGIEVLPYLLKDIYEINEKVLSKEDILTIQSKNIFKCRNENLGVNDENMENNNNFQPKINIENIDMVSNNNSNSGNNSKDNKIELSSKLNTENSKGALKSLELNEDKYKQNMSNTNNFLLDDLDNNNVNIRKLNKISSNNKNLKRRSINKSNTNNIQSNKHLAIPVQSQNLNNTVKEVDIENMVNKVYQIDKRKKNDKKISTTIKPSTNADTVRSNIKTNSMFSSIENKNNLSCKSIIDKLKEYINSNKETSQSFTYFASKTFNIKDLNVINDKRYQESRTLLNMLKYKIYFRYLPRTNEIQFLFHDTSKYYYDSKIKILCQNVAAYLHDFKNPLLALISNIKEVNDLEGEDYFNYINSEEFKKTLNFLQVNGEHCKLMCQNFESFTKDMSEENPNTKVNLNLKIINLFEIVQYLKVWMDYKIKNTEKKIKVEFKVILDDDEFVDEESEENDNNQNFTSLQRIYFIKTDKEKLLNTLINILSNSFKFTDKGKISLIINKEIEKGENFIRFTVRDTGSGMDETTLKNLFMPFNSDNKDANNREGCGLGLVNVKKFTLNLGKEIQVESKKGKGTTMYFLCKDHITKEELDKLSQENIDMNNKDKEINENEDKLEMSHKKFNRSKFSMPKVESDKNLQNINRINSNESSKSQKHNLKISNSHYLNDKNNNLIAEETEENSSYRNQVNLLVGNNKNGNLEINNKALQRCSKYSENSNAFNFNNNLADKNQKSVDLNSINIDEKNEQGALKQKNSVCSSNNIEIIDHPMDSDNKESGISSKRNEESESEDTIICNNMEIAISPRFKSLLERKDTIDENEYCKNSKKYFKLDKENETRRKNLSQTNIYKRNSVNLKRKVQTNNYIYRNISKMYNEGNSNNNVCSSFKNVSIKDLLSNKQKNDNSQMLNGNKKSNVNNNLAILKINELENNNTNAIDNKSRRESNAKDKGNINDISSNLYDLDYLSNCKFTYCGMNAFVQYNDYYNNINNYTVKNKDYIFNPSLLKKINTETFAIMSKYKNIHDSEEENMSKQSIGSINCSFNKNSSRKCSPKTKSSNKVCQTIVSNTNIPSVNNIFRNFSPKKIINCNVNQFPKENLLTVDNMGNNNYNFMSISNHKSNTNNNTGLLTFHTGKKEFSRSKTHYVDDSPNDDKQFNNNKKSLEVLVVDDESSIRHKIISCLKNNESEYDLTIDAKNDGKSVLIMFLNGELNKYDLIIMDGNMEYVDGFHVINIIKFMEKESIGHDKYDYKIINNIVFNTGDPSITKSKLNNLNCNNEIYDKMHFPSKHLMRELLENTIRKRENKVY